MYKTAVYRLVNGGITHKKQQIYGKGDDAAIHRLSMHCRATAVLYINICCFTSDFRSLFNFSVLSLTLETVMFIKNQNSVFTRASVNGVVVWSSTERRTHWTHVQSTCKVLKCLQFVLFYSCRCFLFSLWCSKRTRTVVIFTCYHYVIR